MRMSACSATPSVVPMPRIATWSGVSAPSAAADVPAMTMKRTKAAMATMLLRIGANIGAPNLPRALSTWLSSA